MGRVTVEHNETIRHLFAKVCFDNYESNFGKSQVKKEWEDFKEQVDNAIQLIKSPEDTTKGEKS